MKKLYTHLVSGEGEYEQLLALSGIEETARAQDISFAAEIVAGVEEKQSELDAYIAHYSVNWSVDRLGLVDLCILRMTLYEMLYRQDVPESSAINEAVELAKRFCDEKSPKFINGILGSVSRRDRPQMDAQIALSLSDRVAQPQSDCHELKIEESSEAERFAVKTEII